MYVRWYADLLWIFVPIQGEVAKFAATLKDYPPVTGGSLSGGLSYRAVQIQQALDLLSSQPGGRN
jgi:arylsulfatase